MALQMVRYPDIHQQLKDLVRPALVPYGAKAKLARKMGVAQSYINQWMDEGRQNPGIDKLPAIADFLECAFAVHKSTGLTSHDTPIDQDPASHTGIGGTHGTDAQARDIESTSKEIRKALRKIATVATAALEEHDAGRSVKRARVSKTRARGRADSRSA